MARRCGACGSPILRSTKRTARRRGNRGPRPLTARWPVEEYELVEVGKRYREWCIPAAVLNQLATVELVDETRCEQTPKACVTR